MHCFGGILVNNSKISIFVHKYKFKKIILYKILGIKKKIKKKTKQTVVKN